MTAFGRSLRWLVSRLLCVVLLGGTVGKGAETGGESWVVRDEVVKSWSVQDGLPSSRVTALAQTRDGWLWVGTSAGLARFDGVRFEVYGEGRSLSAMPVEKLTALPDGRLWISNENRRSFWLEGGEVRPDHSGFMEVVVGGDGKVYGIGEREITILPGDAGEGSTEIIPLPASNAQGQFTVEVSADGELWLSAFPGVEQVIWRWRDKEWLPWTDEGEAVGAAPGPSGQVLMTRDDEGAMWLAYGMGFILKARANGEKEGELRVPEGPVPVFSFIQKGHNGEIWAKMSSGGLFRIRDGSYSQYLLRGRDYQPEVTTVMPGQGGEMWIGTSDSGLFRIKRSTVTSTWPQDSERAWVGAIHVEKPGDLVVGTGGGGIWRWRNGLATRFSMEASFNRNYVYGNGFLEARGGSLWVATGNGLHEFRDGRRLTTDEFAKGFHGTSVSSLWEDADGTVWAGCSLGELFRVKSGVVERIPLPTESWILALTRDTSGDLWVATWAGGIVVLKQDGTRQWYRLAEDLPDTRLSQLYLDTRGDVWVSTVGKGLYFQQNGRFVPVPVQGGKELGTVGQIQEDESGWLWVGTSWGICGLNVLDWREGRAQAVVPLWLGADDGVVNEQCTRMKAEKDAEGRLYFGTTRGFVSFQPSDVKSSSVPLVPVLEEIRINGVAKSVDDSTHEIDIPPGAPIEIRFTGPSPELGERTEFRYRLPDIGEQWTETGSQRQIRFPSLPPGLHRFEVQAGLRENWNPTSATMVLRVSPSYWETWWFRCALAVATTGILLALVGAWRRLRSRHLRLELERKQAVNQERERIARDLHDGLGAGLTQAGLIAAEMNQPSEHTGQPSDLSERIRLLALELDSAVWKTNPVYDWLPYLCSYLGDYAQEFFMRTAMNCRFSIDEQIPSIEIPPDTRHHLFLATKECLNNVLKHSDATEVWLVIETAESELKITIRDNGRGFDPTAAERKGRHGIKNLGERLERMGGLASIDSSPGNTAVTLTLPLNLAKAEQSYIPQQATPSYWRYFKTACVRLFT